MIDMRDIRSQEAYRAFLEYFSTLSDEKKACYEQQAREILEEAKDIKAATSRGNSLRVEEPRKPLRQTRGRRPRIRRQ